MSRSVLPGTGESVSVAVVGAGAWGTALANVAAEATGLPVPLIGRDAARMAAIAAAGVNAERLPGVALDPRVRPTADLSTLVRSKIVLLVTPAQTLRAVASGLRRHLAPGAAIVACAKGVERGSHALPPTVLAEALPGFAHALLSGPSFADDVARGLPTAVTLAAEDETLAADLAARLATRSFRLYHATDVTGVALGGAAKNVLAIAAGAAEGRGLGPSAVAALIARGFAELARLGAALGARPETLSGLSGLGDLVLTATSAKSRNFALGRALGRGAPAPEKLAEGAATAGALAALAEALGVEMPISQAVAEVIAGRASVGAAIEGLLARPLKAEA